MLSGHYELLLIAHRRPHELMELLSLLYQALHLRRTWLPNRHLLLTSDRHGLNLSREKLFLGAKVHIFAD